MLFASVPVFFLQTAPVASSKTDPLTTLWNSVINNPAPVVAFISALVAFASFLFNYRTTLRNQRDTQFYEALKRFGDKDSPSLRASAAATLAQMASLRPADYYETAYDQLMVGHMIEDNPITISSISQAAAKLASIRRAWVANVLGRSNRTIYESLARCLADYFVMNEATQIEDVSSAVWMKAEVVTELKKRSILQLSKRTPFPSLMETASIQRAAQREAWAAKVGESMRTLAQTANLMRTNTELYREMMRAEYRVGKVRPLFHRNSPARGTDLFLPQISMRGDIVHALELVESDLPEWEIEHSKLENVVFRSCNLAMASFKGSTLTKVEFDRTALDETDFRFARFSKCTFSSSNLCNAKLFGAQLDEASNLPSQAWWTASYYETDPGAANSGGQENGETPSIDTALLETLYSRSSAGDLRGKLANHAAEIHTSARAFLLGKEQGTEAQPL